MNTPPRTYTYLLAAILLIAALLRAAYFVAIEHNVDHAYPLWQAMMTLDRGVFPLAGQGTSVLFANPALTGYLYLPVVALTRSPLGVYVFVVALNTLAVLLAYRAARAMIGARLALLAAALMAVNPWVIEYSRTSWVQSLLPFFACAVAWLLWPVLLRGSKRPVRRTALAITMLALMAHTYLLAFALLLPVIVLLIIFRRRVPARGLWIGGAVFAVLLGLYGLGLLGQIDTVGQRIQDFTSTGQAHLSGEALGHAVRLVSGADYPLARGSQAPDRDSALRQDLTNVAHAGLAFLMLAGAGVAVAAITLSLRKLRKGVQYLPPQLPLHPVQRRNSADLRHWWRGVGNDVQPEAAIIALVWFSLPVLLMSYVGQPVHPFYQLLGLPAGYVLAAWGAGIVFRPRIQAGARLLLAALIPFMLLNAINSLRYYQETAAIPGAHGLTALPLGDGLKLGRMITAQLPQGGIVYADVEDWILNSFAGRLFPVVRETRAPALTLVPGEGGVYLAVTPGVGMLIAPPALAGPGESLVLADGVHLSVFPFAPGAAADPPCETPLDIPSEQGLTLLCETLDATNDGWMLTTYWRVDALPEDSAARLYGPFVHLFDSAGERVGVFSGEAVPGYEWRIGDLQVQRMVITAPPEAPQAAAGPFSLAVGQYDALHEENVIFLQPQEDGTISYTPLVTLPETLPGP